MTGHGFNKVFTGKNPQIRTFWHKGNSSTMFGAISPKIYVYIYIKLYDCMKNWMEKRWVDFNLKEIFILSNIKMYYSYIGCKRRGGKEWFLLYDLFSLSPCCFVFSPAPSSSCLKPNKHYKLGTLFIGQNYHSTLWYFSS